MNAYVKIFVVVLAISLPAVGLCADKGAANEKAAAGKVYRVSDVFKNKAQLNKQSVTVKGKIVKISAGIMGKTWIHLQDGSGSAAAKDNDLTVTTTQDAPSTGKTVTVTGTVAKDKDFGSGYFYPVIIENATIK
ncbi:hypothetical protein GEOBRER4_n3207 [Citrifermentans bremense]|uniref:DNA-binding protein n=1 Tax=Citrifermentans bremense TaxID=60035 RepID=A0A6S6M3U4_9BACT|nr:hypothetical protein [Citrifermentans bremense]BCG48320.1 hypothetical protein GEOBRER4_n3207 [Citrifermentans bremense]